MTTQVVRTNVARPGVGSPTSENPAAGNNNPATQRVLPQSAAERLAALRAAREKRKAEGVPVGQATGRAQPSPVDAQTSAAQRLAARRLQAAQTSAPVTTTQSYNARTTPQQVHSAATQARRNLLPRRDASVSLTVSPVVNNMSRRLPPVKEKKTDYWKDVEEEMKRVQNKIGELKRSLRTLEAQKQQQREQSRRTMKLELANLKDRIAKVQKEKDEVAAANEAKALAAKMNRLEAALRLMNEERKKGSVEDKDTLLLRRKLALYELKLQQMEAEKKVREEQDQYSNEPNKPSEESTCVVCMEDPPETVIVDCGHLCLCVKCGNDLKFCPMCRVPITKIIKVFKV
jgi:predicted metal-dependent hydrolase